MPSYTKFCSVWKKERYMRAQRSTTHSSLQIRKQISRTNSQCIILTRNQIYLVNIPHEGKGADSIDNRIPLLKYHDSYRTCLYGVEMKNSHKRDAFRSILSLRSCTTHVTSLVIALQPMQQ